MGWASGHGDDSLDRWSDFGNESEGRVGYRNLETQKLHGCERMDGRWRWQVKSQGKSVSTSVQSERPLRGNGLGDFG